MYYDKLTRQYPVSKTLRNELIPIGKTLEHIKKNQILERDMKRKDDYAKVKVIFDNYHKAVISSSLENVSLKHLEEFSSLYFKRNKSDAEKKKMKDLQTALRKEIVAYLKKHEHYGILEKKEIIRELDHFVQTEEEHDALSSFSDFFTYLKGYTMVRANLYSDEEKASTVAFRLIHENLPRFLDNMTAYTLVKEGGLIVEGMSTEEIDKLFLVDTYNYLLTQDRIDYYNDAIGRINSAINLFNQQNKGIRKIPLLKVLYKQLLSDREETFISEFATDAELIDNLDSFLTELCIFVESDIYENFGTELVSSKGENVYVKNNLDLTALSTIVGESWKTLPELIGTKYDADYTGKKTGEKYEEEKAKNLKKVESYEIANLIQIGAPDLLEIFASRLRKDVEEFAEKKGAFDAEIAKHKKDKKLAKNTGAVDATKDVLDSVKKFEADLKLLVGSGNEPVKNAAFYGLLDAVLMEVRRVDALYNMTRNYVTKKPFSTEKVKINFDRATLLNGWDRNKEEANLGLLFTKGGKYYLGIMNTASNKVFRNIPESISQDLYRKVEYKLLPGPNKMLPKVFFADSNISYFAPSERILDIRRKESFKKGDQFSIDDCYELIDFFKDSLNKHEDWSKFNFSFSDTNSYEDISGFYREVEKQGYKLTYTDVDASYIDMLVDQGALYLFEIHNKDFSDYSKGNLNLHTIYFKMLFDERNLKDVVYKLNGEAEIFYRPASISEEEKIVHKAGEPIANKNAIRRQTKETSLMAYDIVKDKRYTEDKFMFHVPVTMNFCTTGSSKYNDRVNNALRNSDGVRVIGIDRGERNLLYVVVVDTDGTILEQISLNSIINKEYSIETDYHSLLMEKENARDKSRKDWKTIENIKDLKEGYLSQVVHVISELVLKYNAVICLEDLNSGFMRGRQKVERQVYQKFEKMLIDKLNYLVIDKTREQNDAEKIGGALNALQLTAPFTSFKELGKQTGILYYVPAYLTSKIDPTTGFANLLYPKYENLESAKGFIRKFDSICFNSKENYFEITFDYQEFTTKANGSQTKWTICTFGNRIEHFRNEDINGNWDEREIELTKQWKQLFDENSIEYLEGQNLLKAIGENTSVKFFKTLMYLMNLTLQMRNSSKEEDYIISPVKNSSGKFFVSNPNDRSLPVDADANGAYNIARKGLWVLDQIRNTEENAKVKLAMTNSEWLLYAQEHTK